GVSVMPRGYFFAPMVSANSIRQVLKCKRNGMSQREAARETSVHRGKVAEIYRGDLTTETKQAPRGRRPHRFINGAQALLIQKRELENRTPFQQLPSHVTSIRGFEYQNSVFGVKK